MQISSALSAPSLSLFACLRIQKTFFHCPPLSHYFRYSLFSFLSLHVLFSCPSIDFGSFCTASLTLLWFQNKTKKLKHSENVTRCSNQLTPVASPSLTSSPFHLFSSFCVDSLSGHSPPVPAWIFLFNLLWLQTEDRTCQPWYLCLHLPGRAQSQYFILIVLIWSAPLPGKSAVVLCFLYFASHF